MEKRAERGLFLAWREALLATTGDAALEAMEVEMAREAEEERATVELVRAADLSADTDVEGRRSIGVGETVG